MDLGRYDRLLLAYLEAVGLIDGFADEFSTGWMIVSLYLAGVLGYAAPGLAAACRIGRSKANRAIYVKMQGKVLAHHISRALADAAFGGCRSSWGRS